MSPTEQWQRVLELHRQETGGLHGGLLLARLLLFPIPEHVGYRLRPFVLRVIGFRIGRGTMMAGTPSIAGPGNPYENLEIGRECFFNVGSMLEVGGKLTIGHRVGLGQGVLIITTSHEPGHPMRRAGTLRGQPVKVGDGAWLGARCVILPGVVVGEGAVVGACALVSRDVPPHTVVAGVPARIIRQLDPEEAKT